MSTLSATRYRARLGIDDVVSGARVHGVDPQVAETAARLLAEGSVSAFALSGKMGAGKDTVGEAVVRTLGIAPAVQVSFAQAMKDEVDEVFALLREAASTDWAAERLVCDFGVARHQAEAAVEHAHGFLRTSPDVHARSRAPEVRRFLQFWGTTVRRGQDPDYWVKRALVPAFAALASGRSIYVTDCRYRNEAAGCQMAGIWVLRLEVSAAVQESRLLARDGVLPHPDAFAHASETDLEGYGDFDLVVDNDGALSCTVDRISRLIRV